MAGTKELKEVVDLGLGVVDVLHAAKADGKVGLEDIGLLLQLIPVVGPAVQGIDQIPAELADMDVQEASDLVAHVMAKLLIDDVKAKEVVVAALGLGVSALKLYKAVKA